MRTKKLLKAAEDEDKSEGEGKKKVAKGRVVELTDGVTVEDIEEEDEKEDYDPTEMTENTPEVRVKVHYLLVYTSMLFVPALHRRQHTQYSVHHTL
ncbi:hypothetical protein EON65_32430 [archaeon]|nr:MAG: hypothetical protein EON65_32430 [archaeon]